MYIIYIYTHLYAHTYALAYMEVHVKFKYTHIDTHVFRCEKIHIQTHIFVYMNTTSENFDLEARHANSLMCVYVQHIHACVCVFTCTVHM